MPIFFFFFFGGGGGGEEFSTKRIGSSGNMSKSAEVRRGRGGSKVVK